MNMKRKLALAGIGIFALAMAVSGSAVIRAADRGAGGVDWDGVRGAVPVGGAGPNVLTHGLLLRQVWGPERVGESWLVRDVVMRLRRKLADDAADPRYIFTEPRVGYRMAKGSQCCD